MKDKETLDEAAYKYALKKRVIKRLSNREFDLCQIDFIKGAKWQQEQDKKMYSEEEVIKFGQWLTLFDNLRNENKYVIKQLLKQFKKK